MSEVIIRAIYPRKCPGCGDVLFPDMTIGECCREKFKKITGPACLKCGRRVENDEDALCDQCKNKKHNYCTGFAVFSYDGLVRKAMSDLKFNGVADNADFFAAEAVELLAEQIRQFAPDALVPVPIHKTRKAFRGYNQAELIANGIAAGMNLKVTADLLLRTRKTNAQKLLGASDRTGNLKNAFICNSTKYNRDTITRDYNRVLLVDDIYTTGTTMNNCTLALLEAGVKEVGILSIAIGG